MNSSSRSNESVQLHKVSIRVALEPYKTLQRLYFMGQPTKEKIKRIKSPGIAIPELSEKIMYIHLSYHNYGSSINKSKKQEPKKFL